jgi:hypothetical protein
MKSGHISSNSFYLLVLRKITNSVTKITIYPHGEKLEIASHAEMTSPVSLRKQGTCANTVYKTNGLY